MQCLEKRSIKYMYPLTNTLPKEEWFKVCHLNVGGYLCHLEDIKQDMTLATADIICVTESI